MTEFISPLLEVFCEYKENNKRQDPAHEEMLTSVKRSRTNMNKINIYIDEDM